MFSVICYDMAYFRESLFSNCFPVAVHDQAAAVQAAFVNLVECFAGLAWEYLYVDDGQQPTLPASLTLINILQLL